MTPRGLQATAFERLRGLARQADSETDYCELCGQPIRVMHEHLLIPDSRKLLCSCLACACLFPASAGATYKRVPRRVIRLECFAITDAEWEDLAIPIGMAFFSKHGDSGRVSATYPSPAGPVESLLSLDAWQEITARSAAIVAMEPDVEVVLANRTAGEYYLAPIDECFRLTGLIRAHWRGLSGGVEVWKEIRGFFDELRRRSTPEAEHA